MITKLFIALTPVGVVLLLSEVLWRKKIIKGERARKFIHVLAGVWIAFWPIYIPFDGIFVLGSVMLAMSLYSRATKLFHAIYAVKRKTYGDILYSVAILCCAYVGREPWIFTISILLLAVADGGAAIAGRLWGMRNQYRVMGFFCLQKSVLGTLTFFVLSLVCVAVGWTSGGGDVIGDNLLVAFIILPISSTVLENIVPYGFDNFVTPLSATLLLNSLL
jgi:dolichol kinase